MRLHPGRQDQIRNGLFPADVDDRDAFLPFHFSRPSNHSRFFRLRLSSSHRWRSFSFDDNRVLIWRRSFSSNDDLFYLTTIFLIWRRSFLSDDDFSHLTTIVLIWRQSYSHLTTIVFSFDNDLSHLTTISLVWRRFFSSDNDRILIWQRSYSHLTTIVLIWRRFFSFDDDRSYLTTIFLIWRRSFSSDDESWGRGCPSVGREDFLCQLSTLAWSERAQGAAPKGAHANRLVHAVARRGMHTCVRTATRESIWPRICPLRATRHALKKTSSRGLLIQRIIDLAFDE